MKALITCEQSRALDAATRETFSVSSFQLMEKASLRIWDSLKAYIDGDPAFSGKGNALKITALCGKGDNGGDALAVIRHAFSSGFTGGAAVVSAREPGESAKKQGESLVAAGLACEKWAGGDAEGLPASLAEADIILDGILGTGLVGPASGEAREMIESLNRLKTARADLFVIAIDLPSGLGDSWNDDFPCVEADLTLCLEPVKAACYLPKARLLCGELVAVADVFPQSLIDENNLDMLIEGRDIAGFIDPVRAESYKMTRGRLAIFAGSMGAVGAAQLCAKAALASGAGYVTLYVDSDIYPILAKALDSVIVKPLGAKPETESCDAILVGPGWGRGEGRAETLKAILESNRPVILDADAIRLLAARPELAASMKAPCAITPHPGEFAALADSLPCGTDLSPRSAMKRVCEGFGVLAILKSHTTWIVSPGSRFSIWDGLTPELGTAGSGDVLSGIFAGLVAGKMARMKSGDSRATWKVLEDAASCAVAAHGLAGKNLAKNSGWFEASDLIAECARILHSNREEKGSGLDRGAAYSLRYGPLDIVHK